MTSKERAYLRSKANRLDAILQIGKGGINENLIAQVDDALFVRELIKLRVLLETTPMPPKELAGLLAEATHSDVVQVIGGIVVLYRETTPEMKQARELAKPKTKKKPNRPNSRKGKVVQGQRSRNAMRRGYSQENPVRRGRSHD